MAGVFVILGQFHRIQRFRQGTYLVDFHQDGIRYMAENALIQIPTFVTNRSSPTSWVLPPMALIELFPNSQSFSAQPSSMEMMGYFFLEVPNSKPSVPPPFCLGRLIF